MNFFILLSFGILNTVYGIYKIPEHDACVLRVLLCDDFTKPLTQVDNSTLEMFETIGELNAVCDELSKFRACLKEAEKFCTEHSDLDVGLQLLKNRRIAFDLCIRNSAHQHVYFMVEGCVNKYSHSVIEFCTDKAVETVGLDFALGDFERECRFLGTIQHCHVAVVTDQCGSIAGNLLERLVIFRGERDFMCIGYENERLNNFEAFDATMDSYVQQYRNTAYQTEKEDKVERIDTLKNLKTLNEGFVQDRTSSKFQARISPIPVEDCFSDTSNRGHPFNPETLPEKPTLFSCLSQHEILDFNMPRNTAQYLRHLYEKQDGNVLSDENYACKTNASFLLTGIHPDGGRYHIGFGEAVVLWGTHSPLKDVSCAWMVHPGVPTTLVNCSILIDHSMLVREICKIKMGCDLSFEAPLAVLETVNEREAKRVAELRVHSFLKYSALDRRFDKMINFFKKHAHDIRYWCSEQHEEQDPIHSTSRKGFLSSEINVLDKIKGQSKMFDEKYNFYASEHQAYPIDTEIRFLFPEDKDLGSGLEVEDNSSPQNYDENFNPFIDEVYYEKNLGEPFPRYPSTTLKSSSRSYRPYELFRPRIGETWEDEDKDMSSQDLGIKDAAESSTNPDVPSFEDSFQNVCTNLQHTHGTCPALPENVSKLVNKFSKENYINIADPLDIINSKGHKFQISEKWEDVSLSNMIWKDQEPEIDTDDQQNKYEEIFVVTASTEMETTSGIDRVVCEYEDTQNRDENSQISNTKDDIQDFAEVPQESDVTKSANIKSSGGDFLEISDYENIKNPFSNKFAEESTNHEVASEEQEFSPKSETFSRRSNQEYPIKIEEQLFNAFEVLAKVKIDVRRILQESRMKNINTSPRKDDKRYK